MFFSRNLKIRGVVLDAVAVPIAEDAQAGLLVNEEESAKVGVELLNARTHGNEIVVVAEIVEFHFDEGFLQAQVVVEAVGASEHVRTNDAKLANVEIIETEFRRDANAPIDWLEGRVAVEKIETEPQSLVEKSLLAASKKTGTAGLARRSHRSAKERAGHRKMFPMTR